MNKETEDLKNGIEFLKEHPIQRINCNPEPYSENKLLPYPFINLNHYIQLTTSEFGGLQVLGNVDNGGDPNLLTDIVIRLVGDYKHDIDTDTYRIYPRLNEGEPMLLFFNNENKLVNKSLSILEKKYPDLIRRSS